MGTLTPEAVHSALPDPDKAQTVLSDGDGLYLRIGHPAKEGKPAPRYWQSRIFWEGKWRWVGIGSAVAKGGKFKAITLQEARRRNLNIQADVEAGVDPRKPKSKTPAPGAKAVTFKDAVEAFLPVQTKALKNPKHIQQWENTLGTYAMPVLGDKLVGEITKADVLAVLQPIWHEKTETASRLRGRIEKVLGWAKSNGHREGDNPATWKGGLEFDLAKPSAIHVPKNHDFIPWKEMPDFIADLWPRDSVAAYALKYCALTGLRAQEFLRATWDEIEDGVHFIPAVRMKAKQDHYVPLSGPAQEILNKLAGLHDTHVLPGPNDKPMSDAAVRKLLTLTMGYDGDRKRKATIHGFRATLRTWMQDQGVPFDLGETALAHQVGSASSRAYTRSQLLERRLPIMEQYAEFVLSKVQRTPRRSRVVG